MVALPQAAETNVDKLLENAGSGKGQPLITPGDYPAVAVTSDMKEASTKGNYFLEIGFVITSGQFQDTEFTERLNLVNPNATAVKIAYETLAKIARAVGMQTIPDDSSKLHNKPLLLSIKTEAGKPWKDRDGNPREGKDKSIIGGYKAVGLVSGNAVGAPAVVGAAKLPWQK